jgi:Protein of unknown function (DUF1360)
VSWDDNGRPVEPVDYAKLNAAYAVLFAGVLAAAHHRKESDDQIPVRELVPLGAATFALAKVIAREKIGSWMREPFVEQDGAQPQGPRGRRLRRAVGELVTCTRCVGAWSALGVVGLRVIDPKSGRIVANVLAASAVNDWMQAGFKLLTEEVNQTQKALEREDRELAGSG